MLADFPDIKMNYIENEIAVDGEEDDPDEMEEHDEELGKKDLRNTMRN
jgi:hypothetical protein